MKMHGINILQFASECIYFVPCSEQRKRVCVHTCILSFCMRACMQVLCMSVCMCEVDWVAGIHACICCQPVVTLVEETVKGIN